MPMRFLAVIIAGLLTIASCSKKQIKPDPELDAIQAYAQAEVTIEHMRTQYNPDWSAIKEQYEITAPVVREIDLTYTTDYDAEIRASLEKCAAGERVKVNQQVLAKGLQHVTVCAIHRVLERILEENNADKRPSLAEHVAAYFEGIRPIFSCRDKDFFKGEKVLESTADAMIGNLKKAVLSGSGIATACRDIRDIIARTYSLCVLFEISEIEKLRSTGLEKCDVKKMEAVIFYRIIKERIKKNDPKADGIITAMLQGSYDAMSSEILSEQLKKGLHGSRPGLR